MMPFLNTHAPLKQSTNEKKIVTTCYPSDTHTIDTIGPFDVLCGRDKQSFNNIGNRRFRILISLNLPRYLECNSRCERSAMILSLTRELCQSATGLRFFKRVQTQSELILLDFKQSRDKVGHALRDAASQQRENCSKIAKQQLKDSDQQEGGQFNDIFTGNNKMNLPVSIDTHNNPAARLDMLVSGSNNEEENDEDTPFSSLVFHMIDGLSTEANGKRIGSFSFNDAIAAPL